MKPRRIPFACVCIIAVAAVAVIALAGCTSSQSSSASSTSGASQGGSSSVSSDSASSASSSSDVVEVLDGNLAYTVYLDFSAGTGYVWECAFVEESPSCSISDERDVDMSGDKDLAGGPMCHEVVVWAKEPGQATLECKLVRPWENSEPAEVQRFVFEVDAQGQMHFDEANSNFVNPPEVMNLS